MNLKRHAGSGISSLESKDQDNDTVVLLLQVPRTNEKKELAAEQMFASLHGLLMFQPQRFLESAKRVRISFEIAVLKKRIGFYVCTPKYLKNFIEEQIYAQYPSVHISEVEDYTMSDEIKANSQLVSELRLVNNNALPIKTFQSFEVDPLAAITATLAKFDENEEAWIQLVMRPAHKNWHKKSERYISSVKSSSGSSGSLVKALWAPPSGAGSESVKLTEYEQARASGAEDKSHKLAFEATLRIVYKGSLSLQQAQLRMQSIISSYKQFNTTYLNGFEQSKISEDKSMIRKYQERVMNTKPSIFNIEEVASLYHLPHTNVETPYILWAQSQTAEPPSNLPVATIENQLEISPIAATTFRGQQSAFGLPRSDRGRHLYILGQTGVGKSGLLELLTMSDIYAGHGFAVIDPHGDYALSTLRRIPENRVKDVIYFNPADTDYPIAFNPMEVPDPKLRNHTASELIGVLKKMFESWGPRLEYILRYSLLALLEYPESTMLDITRILTDRKFRMDVLEHVSDPVVRNFWNVEFASWNERFAAEAVSPVLNKIGAFTANPIVRNIIGQPKSSFNIRKIMDERKILIVNLSRGLVGEDNAALLGALLVTKIQLASMSRSDIPAGDRVPFYLYVDEFQHFATDSFATILSEARKYGLYLAVANQYIAQMSQEVKDAVFGNVGSMIAFRMGADDARVMLKYFEPKFEEYDLVHMHNRHFVINMTIGGEKTPAFSAVTLDLPEQSHDETQAIVQHSRENYSLVKSSVETHIGKQYKEIKMAAAPPPRARPESESKSRVETKEVKMPEKERVHMPSVSSVSPSSVGEAAIKGSEIVQKPKGKRRRHRKKKADTLKENTEQVIFIQRNE
jgi:hypothetical protein